MLKFSDATISDGKRLVRGEHWLAVRTFLRRRDRVHHAKWRLVTLAGGSPTGEIECLRYLMPKAHITCVDFEQECCEAAIEAGADDVIRGDIIDALCCSPGRGKGRPRLSGEFSALNEADAINLDMCGPANDDLALAIRRAAQAVRKGAVLATFSYGRDVREIYDDGEWKGIPAPLGGRARLLDWPGGANQHGIVSALAYAGNAMPMCSLLWLPNQGCPSDRRGMPVFERVLDADLSLAIEHLDAAPLVCAAA